MYLDVLVRVGNNSFGKRKQTRYMGMVPLDRITQDIYIINSLETQIDRMYIILTKQREKFRNGASEQDGIT